MDDNSPVKTPIVVDIGGERICCTLLDFWEANKDGLDPETMEDIAATIARGDVYRDGGGASPEWSVKAANIRVVGQSSRPFERTAALHPPSDPAPGHTDLMVPPESIGFMEANPLPVEQEKERERIARIVDPYAEWGSAPCTRFRGTEGHGNWDQFYVWDSEYSTIVNPDGPGASTYPWRKMETAEQSIETARLLNEKQDAPWRSRQEAALAKADAILSAQPHLAASEKVREALADLEREAHATRDTANCNTWMHGKAEGLLEAVGRIEFALSASAGTEWRRESEWHEDFGAVVWQAFPVSEPPWIGTPLDEDWPGYHTHWTSIVVPAPPIPAVNRP